MDWLRASNVAPTRTFVTHGDPAAADAMRRHLRDRLGMSAVVPDHGSSYPLAVIDRKASAPVSS